MKYYAVFNHHEIISSEALGIIFNTLMEKIV